ncbi:MAG: PIN domain-containing protein [Verrucomicrobiales bacterium]|nr:PIN domain-containing protein [Verrucomicrobiales bacterium]
MKYLLDSNVLSEPVKAKPDPTVVAWLDSNELECAVSTITLAELRYGIERLPDGKRRRQLERDFAFLRQDLGSRVVAFDEAEAAEWGRYAAKLERELGRDAQRKIGIKDSQIAATALAHRLIVVTRNSDHFPQVHTLNPFAS